jgi:hypothetical protein
VRNIGRSEESRSLLLTAAASGALQLRMQLPTEVVLILVTALKVPDKLDLALKLNNLGLSAQQKQVFATQGRRTQKGRCQHDATVQNPREALGQLEVEIAQARGRGI